MQLGLVPPLSSDSVDLVKKFGVVDVNSVWPDPDYWAYTRMLGNV